MLDLDALSIDRFKFTLDGAIHEVNPPKKKVLNKIMALSKNTDDETEIIEGLFDSLKLVLDSNKAGKVFTIEFIEEKFDLQMASTFLTKYFEWTGQVNKNPN